MTGRAYLERIGERIARTGAVLCIGLDPDPAELPRGFSRDAVGAAAFAQLIVESCAPLAAAFKPNLAFYEAFGPAGLVALQAVRDSIPADIPVILDAKRGDIGSTAGRQAVGLVAGLGADAVTVSPYLGADAVEPFLAQGAFAYVLCRTSNPSAAEVQDLVVGPAGERLDQRIARLVRSWDAGRATLGLVVGATAPHEMAGIRAAVPELPFLVPGVGAQGGSLEAALRDGPASAGSAAGIPGGALLVNVSRAIAQAAQGAADPGRALSEAAAAWRARLRVLDSNPVSPHGSVA
jgi:orotidine-5'-phosphate decarboxylase